MSLIILVIKSFFFFGANNYNFGKKPHISHFFLLFYRKIIKVVYIMLAIAIKNLKVHLSNLNVPLSKNAIWFELFAEKKETDKQTTSTLYY